MNLDIVMQTCIDVKITLTESPLLCRDIASDRRELAKLGITHILNCAQSKWRGGAEYYAGMNITYHGIEAHDSPTFDMSVNFYPAAEFIHKALSSGGQSVNAEDMHTHEVHPLMSNASKYLK